MLGVAAVPAVVEADGYEPVFGEDGKRRLHRRDALRRRGADGVVAVGQVAEVKNHRIRRRDVVRHTAVAGANEGRTVKQPRPGQPFPGAFDRLRLNIKGKQMPRFADQLTQHRSIPSPAGRCIYAGHAGAQPSPPEGVAQLQGILVKIGHTRFFSSSST